MVAGEACVGAHEGLVTACIVVIHCSMPAVSFCIAADNAILICR